METIKTARESAINSVATYIDEDVKAAMECSNYEIYLYMRNDDRNIECIDECCETPEEIIQIAKEEFVR